MTRIADPRKRALGTTSRARQIRRDDTDAEYQLWCDLRNRQLDGFKFARQIPLGPYIVDLLCRSEMLVVEPDGDQHAESAANAVRTAWLNARGYSVLRFWSREVLRERGSVLDTISAVLQGKVTTPSPDLHFAPAFGCASLSPVGRGEVPPRSRRSDRRVGEAP